MIVMSMKWKGITPDQYEKARKTVRWEEDVPKGAMFHVSSFADNTLHVTDVWKSDSDFQNFVKTRLMPSVKKLGIKGEPKVAIHPIHALFAPAFTPKK